MNNGQPIGTPLMHEREVESVSFSSDDKTILTGSEDGTARLSDVASRLPVGQPMEHKETVWSAAFSPDGKTILTGSWDNTARLWDAATGLPIGKSMRHQGWVTSVAFSPDGKSVLTGGFDKMARLWAAPEQLPDDIPRMAAWVRTSTGLDLNEKGSVRDQQRRVAAEPRTPQPTRRRAVSGDRDVAGSHRLWSPSDRAGSLVGRAPTLGGGRVSIRRGGPRSPAEQLGLP